MNASAKKKEANERKELCNLVENVVGGSKRLVEIEEEGIYSVGAIFTKKDYSTLRSLLTLIHDNLLIRA